MANDEHSPGPDATAATPRRPVRVVFCWSAISGYMAACWKALARRPGVELHVITHGGRDSDFSSRLLDGLSHRLLGPHECHDANLVSRLVAERSPHVVAMTGWWLSAYRALLAARALRGVRFIMGVDSPWRHEGQFLTRLRYATTLARVDHFFVAGERAWQYVRRLGVPPERISRGMYGIDAESWAAAAEARQGHPWPRRFLYLGRYAREKAVDVLVDAYDRYRRSAPDPWGLVCCGSGPLGELVAGRAGVKNLGFVQPAGLGEVFRDAGAFVIPSRFDPWPLALVEAAAAGLPIVCTDACGSAVEVVRHLYNGFVVPAESAAALANAMAALTARTSDLPAWGARSRELAAAYSSELWADRWLDQIRRMT